MIFQVPKTDIYLDDQLFFSKKRKKKDFYKKKTFESLFFLRLKVDFLGGEMGGGNGGAGGGVRCWRGWARGIPPTQDTFRGDSRFFFHDIQKIEYFRLFWEFLKRGFTKKGKPQLFFMGHILFLCNFL